MTTRKTLRTNWLVTPADELQLRKLYNQPARIRYLSKRGRSQHEIQLYLGVTEELVTDTLG